MLDLHRLPNTKSVVLKSTWVFSTVVLVVVFYFLIPLPKDTSRLVILGLLLVLLALWLAYVVRQLFKIQRSERPYIVLAQSLMTALVLLVTAFALVYLTLSLGNPDVFTIPLDKSSALYFSMTVTSTVGFGDITPTDAMGRNIVTFQMFINIVILGVALRALASVAQVASQRRAKDSQPS